MDFASVGIGGEPLTGSSALSRVEVSCVSFNGLELSQLGSEIPSDKSGPSF